MAVFIGEVISTYDEYDGERIKVRILPQDKFKSVGEITYAFPLLPKMLHVKPKEGEAVAVICTDDDPKSQRWYIGPIISQPQFMYKDNYAIGATTLLKGGVKAPEQALSNIAEAKGALAESEDIAIYGRKNSDIILSDNDVRIRCGAHLVQETNENNISFNKSAPAYIKLKYYPIPLNQKNIGNSNYFINTFNDNNHSSTESTATIVADKINLISPNGNPYIDVTNADGGITDEEMKKIIEKAHKLPYGDVLVDFLISFLEMFKSHTHKYSQLPPCPDSASTIFNMKYGSTKESLEEKLLSKDIRIN